MRLLFTLLAAPLIFASGHGFAQSGDLAGVTMRVVDDLSGIDAVVLELQAAPAESTEDAGEAEAAEERESEDSSGRQERDEPEGAERPVLLPPA
jgi:hypothetical protein